MTYVISGMRPVTWAAVASTHDAYGEWPSESSRSGLWRSSLSLEGERHRGEVLVAEALIDSLLPFLSQARKGGEAVAAGCLKGEAYVLERDKANWAEKSPLAMRCNFAACQADTSGLPVRAFSTVSVSSPNR